MGKLDTKVCLINDPKYRRNPENTIRKQTYQFREIPANWLPDTHKFSQILKDLKVSDTFHAATRGRQSFQEHFRPRRKCDVAVTSCFLNHSVPYLPTCIIITKNSRSHKARYQHSPNVTKRNYDVNMTSHLTIVPALSTAGEGMTSHLDLGGERPVMG